MKVLGHHWLESEVKPFQLTNFWNNFLVDIVPSPSLNLGIFLTKSQTIAQVLQNKIYCHRKVHARESFSVFVSMNAITYIIN